MSPRDRLAAVLAPDVLAALDEWIAERVASAAELVPPLSPWLSAEDAAGYVGVSKRTIERAQARGRLRSAEVGRRRVYHRDDLDAWIRASGEEQR